MLHNCRAQEMRGVHTQGWYACHTWEHHGPTAARAMRTLKNRPSTKSYRKKGVPSTALQRTQAHTPAHAQQIHTLTKMHTHDTNTG